MILGPGTCWFNKKVGADDLPFFYIEDSSGEVYAAAEVRFCSDGDEEAEVYTEYEPEGFLDLLGGPRGVVRMARGLAELVDAELIAT